jgi:tetratricopeptide (TPR) repeat protein
MTASTTPEAAPARESLLAVPVFCAGIVAATFATYARDFGSPFLYDDVDSILGNETLRHLWAALRPPLGLTVSGRPVLNLSFALNYAVSGTAVWSYHALNVAIHACAALLLFGIIRRTLAQSGQLRRPAAGPAALAFGAALLWALHPLQTESVAYVVQRAESLMGLFYLLMLYAFVRLSEPGARRGGWAALSLAACLLGMGTKEVMATAPLMVLLYDRAFVSGSFREAWRTRKGLFLSYGACWLPLAFLVAGTAGRGGSAGFGSGVPWWAYLLTQCTAVLRYLRLSLWPHPLVGDYGRILAGSPVEVALCAGLLLVLLAWTCVLLRRNAPVGFLGAWFFLILAPSSSVIPVSTEIMAEHRMYLSLAAVITLFVIGGGRVLGRGVFLTGIGLIAIFFATVTVRREGVYQSSLTFWSDVARKVPANAGAWNNLGIILAGQGDQAGAIEHYRRALEAAPTYAYAHYNLGNSLSETGRTDEAVEQYREALRFRPDDPSIHFNLGNALAREKKEPEAAAQFRETLRVDPRRADAWFNLADALMQSGDLAQVADCYAHAVRLRPDFADARVNYGNVLAQMGRYPEAVSEFGEALRLEPGAADVHNNLGGVLAEAGRLSEARAQFEEALRLKPDYAEARDNLERVRSLLGQAGGRP